MYVGAKTKLNDNCTSPEIPLNFMPMSNGVTASELSWYKFCTTTDLYVVSCTGGE